MKLSKRIRLIEVLDKRIASSHSESPSHLYLDPDLPTLNPSPLRPDCQVSQRLRLWKPMEDHHMIEGEGRTTNLNNEDLLRIKSVIENAYAPATRSTYGVGLYVFHLFCQYKEIDELHRAPVQQTTLACFISTLAGVYGGSTVKNYFFGIRAWHIIHGLPWKVNEDEVKALLTASTKMSPKEAARREKEPWTIDHLTVLCEKLDLNDPEDAAFHACITTAFWGAARLGEVTVPNLDAFNPSTHVKASDVEFNVQDRNGLTQTVIFIPWTKAARERGEKIFWAEQEGIVDPQAALANHLKVNIPPNNSHLFSFMFKGKRRPMSRTVFTTRLRKLISGTGLPNLTGHGLRVGATLEYLLRGTPFDVVKAKGRWQSDAFKGYLRKHAQVMAPYMQKDPKAHETFVRYAMPPVR